MPRVLSEQEILGHEAMLKSSGYCIVEALLDEVETAAMAAALQPLQAETPLGDNDFTGFMTRRVFNLAAKTRALDQAILNPDVLRLIRAALGAPIQVSILSTMEIFPGETPQALHQDDAYFRLQRPHPALVLNTMWALTEFTEANGATRLVPGSNHWDQDVDVRARSIAAAMPKGSVLLWDGAVWHGGGANTTDKVRFGVSMNFCRGWLRQQENQYLAIPRTIAAALPTALQKLLGYDTCEFVGFVDRTHPLTALGGAPGEARTS